MSQVIKTRGVAGEDKASAGVLLDANFTGTLTCSFLSEWISAITKSNRAGKDADGSILAYYTCNGEKKLLNVSKLYVMASKAGITQLAQGDDFVLDSSIQFSLSIEKGVYKTLALATAKAAKGKK